MKGEMADFIRLGLKEQPVKASAGANPELFLFIDIHAQYVVITKVVLAFGVSLKLLFNFFCKGIVTVYPSSSRPDPDDIWFFLNDGIYNVAADRDASGVGQMFNLVVFSKVVSSRAVPGYLHMNYPVSAGAKPNVIEGVDANRIH